MNIDNHPVKMLKINKNKKNSNCHYFVKYQKFIVKVRMKYINYYFLCTFYFKT